MKAALLVSLLGVITNVIECTAVRPNSRSKRPRPSSGSKSRITCTVSIRNDLNLNAPVFFKNGQLELPSEGEFEWQQHDSVQVLCSVGSNTLVNTNKPQDTIQCYNGTKFRVGRTTTTIDAIKCKNKNTGDVEVTKQSCASGSGRLMDVGFRSKKSFLKLYKSCVDEKNASVLYTHHQLYGPQIKRKSISNRDVGFKSEGFPGKTNPRTAYGQNEQRDRLSKLLNSTTAARKYLNQTSFLHRGHLTPDGDQLLNTWQWATYFYINVAPMWSSINTGIWKSLETTVRDFASRNRLNLDVYTGTDGVLRLQGIAFKLDANGIPVPRWLWKVIKTQNSAIAFVVSNNPFDNDTFSCGSNNAVSSWKGAGLVSRITFCSVADAGKHIGVIPREAYTNNVLAYK